MTPNEYLALTRPHQRLLQQLVVDLGFYIEDVGPLAIFSIEHRVKSYESALTKAHRLQKPVEQLYDLAGLRIVVGTEPEVEVAKYFFRLKEIVKDLTIRRDWVVEHPNGYRATHLVVGFAGHYTRSVFPVEVEVQIPTILEHAFNFTTPIWPFTTPIQVFTMPRFECSRWADLGVHDGPRSAARARGVPSEPPSLTFFTVPSRSMTNRTETLPSRFGFRPRPSS